MEAWLSAAQTSLSSSSSSVEQCEESLHLLSARLHPSHLLLLQLKQKLAGLYGSLPGLTRPARERRLQLLMDLVESNSKVSAQVFCESGLNGGQRFHCLADGLVVLVLVTLVHHVIQ